MDKNLDIKIYKYNFNGSNYYGQGLDESIVRNCIETRLSLDSGTLPVGFLLTNKYEITKVVGNANYEYLLRGLKLPLRISINRYTINGIYQSSPLPRPLIDKIIRKELNIDYNVYESMDKNTSFLKLLRDSNNKIIIKTHKILKNLVPVPVITDNGSRYYTMQSVVVDIKDKIQEIESWIKRLIRHDYKLITEFEYYEDKIRRLNASLKQSDHIINNLYVYDSAKKILEKIKDRKGSLYLDFIKLGFISNTYSKEKFTNHTNEEYENLIQDFINFHRSMLKEIPIQIEECKQLIKESEIHVYFNTGYYVNHNNKYILNNNEEVSNKLNELYNKIRNKLIRQSFQNVPTSHNPEITLLDYLDSYQIIVNNSKARVS